MIPNTHTGTRIDEVARGIYRISHVGRTVSIRRSTITWAGLGA